MKHNFLYFLLIFILLFFGCKEHPKENRIMINPSYGIWDVPVYNSDGSMIKELKGCKVYLGTKSGDPYDILTINVYEKNVIDLKIKELKNGIYYGVVTCINDYDRESKYSNEITFEIKR